jgi:hypothetical protein
MKPTLPTMISVVTQCFKRQVVSPAYPVSYVVGVQYDISHWKLSGGEPLLSWRLFLHGTRGREETVWSQPELLNIYLRRGPAAGVRVLQPHENLPLLLSNLDGSATLEERKALLHRHRCKPRILKFTTEAHLDLSNHVFPDTVLITRVRINTRLAEKKVQVSYCENGFYRERHFDPLEYRRWLKSNSTAQFV